MICKTAWRSGRLDHLVLLLGAEFALAIVSDLLGRIVGYADSVLSEMFTNATSVRLMEHAATLDLEDFEDPELQDRLGRFGLHLWITDGRDDVGGARSHPAEHRDQRSDRNFAGADRRGEPRDAVGSEGFTRE